MSRTLVNVLVDLSENLSFFIIIVKQNGCDELTHIASWQRNGAQGYGFNTGERRLCVYTIIQDFRLKSINV